MISIDFTPPRRLLAQHPRRPSPTTARPSRAFPLWAAANGNLKAISKLVSGRPVSEVTDILRGNTLRVQAHLLRRSAVLRARRRSGAGARMSVRETALPIRLALRAIAARPLPRPPNRRGVHANAASHLGSIARGGCGHGGPSRFRPGGSSDVKETSGEPQVVDDSQLVGVLDGDYEKRRQPVHRGAGGLRCRWARCCVP